MAEQTKSQQQLKACPDTPNCVVSHYSEDEKHFMPPWKHQLPQKEVYEAILHFLKNEKRVELLKKTDDYIHASFKIPVMGYIDDVEFLFPKGEKEVHFRSASRKGHYDLGVNKRRMKRIRKKLQKRGLKVH